MVLEVLTRENQQFFEHLIPAEFVSRLGLPGIVATGAALSQDELPKSDGDEAELAEDELMPAGAIVLSLARKDTIEILWLAVAPEYQEREIGTTLMGEAFQLAKKMNRSRLLAALPKAEEGEDMSEGRYFFLARGFRESGTDVPEWSFPAKELKGLSALDGKGKRTGIVSPEALSEEVRRKLLIDAVEEKKEDPFVFMHRFLDPKLGAVYVSNGKPKAAVLLERLGVTMRPVPVSFSNVDREIQTALLETVFVKVREELTGEQIIHFLPEKKEEADLFGEILNGIPAATLEYYEATADAFEEAAEEILKSLRLEEEAKRSEEEFSTEFREIGAELAGGQILTASQWV